MGGIAMQWLHEVLTGNPSPESVERLCTAVRTWWLSGNREQRGANGRRLRSSALSLARCAGLPENPEAARLWLRNWHLKRAALELGVPACNPSIQANALRAAAHEFMARRWPSWCWLESPPTRSSELDRQLWHAARAAAGKLPGTARRYGQILKD